MAVAKRVHVHHGIQHLPQDVERFALRQRPFLLHLLMQVAAWTELENHAPLGIALAYLNEIDNVGVRVRLAGDSRQLLQRDDLEVDHAPVLVGDFHLLDGVSLLGLEALGLDHIAEAPAPEQPRLLVRGLKRRGTLGQGLLRAQAPHR